MSIEELENKLLDAEDIFLELEDEYEDVRISKKIICARGGVQFRTDINMVPNEVNINDVRGFSIKIFLTSNNNPRSKSNLDNKLKKTINLIKKSKQVLENVEIITISTGHHVGQDSTFKSIEKIETHDFSDLRPPISIRIDFKFVSSRIPCPKFKHLKSFNLTI